MHERGGLEDERCCSCGAPLETDDHLFQCPRRPQFHRRLLAIINDMRQTLDPCLFFILYSGVNNYISQNDNSEEELILPPTTKKRSPHIDSDTDLSDSDTADERPPTRRKRKRNQCEPEKARDLYLLKKEQAALGWDNFL